MKRVVIITSSLRDGSNSNILAESFKEGAESANNIVEIISLKDNRIAPCLGCNYCQVHGECVIKDKLNEILEKIIESDVFVFASPVYFYSITGSLKNFIDRCYSKYTKIKNKDFYFIASCADDNKNTIDRCLQSVDGFIDCLDNVNIKGVVYGTNLLDSSDAKYSNVLTNAYEMGKNI